MSVKIERDRLMGRTMSPSLAILSSVCFRMENDHDDVELDPNEDTPEHPRCHIDEANILSSAFQVCFFVSSLSHDLSNLFRCFVLFLSFSKTWMDPLLRLGNMHPISEMDIRHWGRREDDGRRGGSRLADRH